MSILRLLLVLFAVPALGTVQAAPGVIISEFMALNNNTLQDEDGDYSDWIELYNNSTNIVNLYNWCLSNKSTNLIQWKFPATNIGPNSFLVVFASNKNRKVPGAPLHTNFKLKGSGEYLALAMPDGATIATEFTPAFPPQYADISYGNVMTGVVSAVVASNATARAVVPGSDIGTSWRLAGYDDSAWNAGTLGVGYDTSGAYAPAIGLNLRSAMLSLNSSAYIRVPFTIDDPSLCKLLTLSMRYDDGFVAYLNGNEVLRRNAPATLAWNSGATATHGTPSAGSLTETFEGSGTNYTLTQYASAPAPAVQAPGAGSTGKFLRLLYDGVNGSDNTITFRQTAPGLFQTITADFDFRISSAINNPADGFAFMLIPTTVYGTNGPGVNITSQAVEQPNYAGVFGVGFRVYPHPSVNTVSAHWNGVKFGETTIATATLDLAAAVFHHAKVRLGHTNGGALVTITLTRNINGTPGTPFSPIANLFIAGLNPFDCRVQFGGRTGGLNLALDLDNCSVQFVPPQGPIAFEDFDLTASRNLLGPGANMLAVQGMTTFAGSSNFLIQPQLLGRDLTLLSPPTYLYPPTPGAWNNSLGTPLVPPPVTFWPLAGSYASNTLAVTLSCDAPLANVYYTLDGSTPGTNSLLYTNTLAFGTNVVIRARAQLNGVFGPTAAANYILLDSTVTNFSSNLPLVIVDTLGQAIPDGATIGAYGIFIDTNAIGGRTSLTLTGAYAGRIDLGLHGQSSLGFPKQPYKIGLADENNGGAPDYPLLGMPAGNDWTFDPPYDDKTLMNDFLSYELFEAMGHYSVRRKYFELFLHRTAGKLSYSDYQGVYVLIEKIRIDTNRVSIAQLSTSDNMPPAVTGGYIIAKDKLDGTNELTFTTPSGQLLKMYRPAAEEITEPQFDYISRYVSALEAALYGPNWRDPLTGYAAYLDVDSFVDLHWIVEFSKNIDGVRLSDYMNKDRNGKLTAGPIWDWDLSWGNANYNDGGRTNGWYYQVISDVDDIWLRQLRADPDFYQKIIDRWGALRLNVFNATNLLARVDQITNYLQEAQIRDFAAWPRLGTYIWPNPDGAAGGWDVDYVNPTTYAGIISEFKKFILGRYLWIDQQFLRAPTLATNSGVLTLSTPLGSIYYTLDNTDPRASGGGLSGSARLYSGPVNLTNNAGIVARAFYTNAWGAAARALYIVNVPDLRITEIMYHPAPPPTNSPYEEKDFEFIEVQNTGSNVLNLAGVSLGGGINFTFAPYQWNWVGEATTNNFDGAPGTTGFTASTLSAPPGSFITNDRPTGQMLCLLNSTTNASRNRIAFNQTSAGNCGRVVADFDFRATSGSSAPGGAATHQDFDNAGTAYTLTYNGSSGPAVLAAEPGCSGSFLRLVPSSGSQLGVVTFDRSATGAFNSVVVTFDFRITPPSGAIAADGVGFALLNTAFYGTNGAGPFFAEEPNLTGSLGVGFDVYNNGSTLQEPNNNHVSLHWNGTQVGNAATPSFMMANGAFHRAQILVWFSGTSAYLTVRLTPNINGTPGPTETVIEGAPIPGASSYQSRAAFGARTGGAWASHDIDNITIQYGQSQSAAPGLSVVFLPVAQYGASGPGTTLAAFTDWPRVTNTFAFDLAFNPSNLVNDVSLFWNGALARSFCLQATSIDLDAGVFHHACLQLDAASGGVYAAATLTPNSLVAPGPPVTVFSNQYIAGVTLGNSRLEFAGRSGGLVSRVDVDNAGCTFQSLLPLLLNPGESIVVVHNLAAFTSRYGTGIRIAGEFTGSLSNEGERLTLLGSLGEPVLDFSYNPSWYPITDGSGFSLVAADPTAPPANWGLPGNWRASSGLGGSPGAQDPPAPAPVLNANVAGSCLTLTWPASSGNFQLFSAPNLIPPVQWTMIANAPVLVGAHWIVSLSSAPQGARFFRLQNSN